jgi:CYTH domain-containing protein
LIIEIDTYRGRNAGLVVAEVEFPTYAAARKFQPPSWFGREVTGEKRYSNVKLARE